MKYTVEKIEKIQIKLRSMPTVEKDKAEINRRESVKMLAKEIGELQKRGYTLEQIAHLLRDEGLAVATPTLKSYLQRAKSSTVKNKRNPAPPAAPGDTPPAPTAAARQAAAKPNKTRSGFIAKSDSLEI